MFGLTRREQRWKAEKEAAEAALGFVGKVVRAAADIAVAEAKTDSEELEKLRAENAALREDVKKWKALAEANQAGWEACQKRQRRLGRY